MRSRTRPPEKGRFDSLGTAILSLPAVSAVAAPPPVEQDGHQDHDPDSDPRHLGDRVRHRPVECQYQGDPHGRKSETREAADVRRLAARTDVRIGRDVVRQRLVIVDVLERLRHLLPYDTPRMAGRFDRFLDLLSRTEVSERACNQFSRLSGDVAMNAVRRRNLRLYLEDLDAIGPRTLLIGEAPSYRGGRLTGIAFVSESLMLCAVDHTRGRTLGEDRGFRKATSSPKP